MIFWNISNRRTRIKNADIFFISLGKSGRTWIRTFVNKYFSIKYNTPFHLYLTDETEKEWKNIFFTHELWEHYTKATFPQRLTGKYIIPNKYLRSKKSIFLYRDPRDIVTSLYYQMTKRSSSSQSFSKHEFIRHEVYGIQNIISTLNKWHARLYGLNNSLWNSYENFLLDPYTNFFNLAYFIESKHPQMDAFEQSLSFSDFKNMQNLEKNDSFNTSILRPKNINDPNSFKVRKGKIGGYLDEFSDEDINYMNHELQNLHPFFNYK
ncbi:sulfotransferase domain-containing protein [Desulfohalobium retbaense]|uniref:Sulfotransferase domain-containing protein n=1 Tax=Desulfohalobium retbaense (strain ATCC 49708 / DSM 5692 / JCM 16813 / HR100) TaxID=485915 RepID=C8WZW3_DESRD|nr:sulfotransferase domain-containing protein [Desulfohalobium retbaense]ACV67588.1 hypothetical protein Dret_0286 [Desulfohalobium retbaense DSM 5692]